MDTIATEPTEEIEIILKPIAEEGEGADGESDNELQSQTSGLELQLELELEKELVDSLNRDREEAAN